MTISPIVIDRFLRRVASEGGLEFTSGPDEPTAEIAAAAQREGLISISIGWGDDEYYKITRRGLRRIGIEPKPTLIERAVRKLAAPARR